jgi:thiazole synthase ThiGH ThiG subunit
MTDIVATETAKAQEVTNRLFGGRGDIDDDSVIVTALLEAKAEAYEIAARRVEHAPGTGLAIPAALLRQEVWNRRARGL